MKDDIHTSTVDGAAGFQRAYNSYADEYRVSKRDLDNEAAEELFKEKWGAYPKDLTDEELEAIFNEEDNECNCSDPGCPCGGIKRGGV